MGKRVSSAKARESESETEEEIGSPETVGVDGSAEWKTLIELQKLIEACGEDEEEERERRESWTMGATSDIED